MRKQSESRLSVHKQLGIEYVLMILVLLSSLGHSSNCLQCVFMSLPGHFSILCAGEVTCYSTVVRYSAAILTPVVLLAGLFTVLVSV